VTPLEPRFQSELLGGEHLLWTGQPDPRVIFERVDIFLVPFSLLWGGFALVWEAGVLGSGVFGEGHRSAAPWFFVLWGIPFVVIGLYFIAGRFFYKAWRKRRTYYALTTKRALILIESRGRMLRACFLSAVPTINTSVRPERSRHHHLWQRFVGVDVRQHRHGFLRHHGRARPRLDRSLQRRPRRRPRLWPGHGRAKGAAQWLIAISASRRPRSSSP